MATSKDKQTDPKVEKAKPKAKAKRVIKKKPKTGKVGKRRNAEEKERDMAVISSMYLMGDSLRTISEKLNKRKDIQYTLSYEQVRTEVKNCKGLWRTEMLIDFDAAVAERIAAMRLLIKETWKAYEESKKPETQTQLIFEPALDANGEPIIDQNGNALQRPVKKAMVARSRVGSISHLRLLKELWKELNGIIGFYSIHKDDKPGQHDPEEIKEGYDDFTQEQMNILALGSTDDMLDFDNMDGLENTDFTPFTEVNAD